MYEDFIKELTISLQDHNVENIDEVVNDYKSRYLALIDSGKSEFESVIALGDPEEIACKLAGNSYSTQDKLQNNIIKDAPAPKVSKAKPPTKAGIICSDIFILTPVTIICSVCLIALAVVSGISGFAGFCYAIKAWSMFSLLKDQIICFVMALIGIALFVLGTILTVQLIKTMVRGIRDYAKDRAEKMNIIKETHTNDKTIHN